MNLALIAANVASIEAVPQCVWDALADGEATRTMALLWAARGYDVLAYETHGLWCLWLTDHRVELGRVATASAGGGE